MATKAACLDNTSDAAGLYAGAYGCGNPISAPRQVIDQLDASLAIPQGDRSDYVIAAASIIASVRLSSVPLGLPVDLQPCSNAERTVGLRLA